jgi:hypothetical protein
MSKFTYKIDNFDETTLVLDVSFPGEPADRSWARIQLTPPLPTSPAELDNIVRRYARTQKDADALAAKLAALTPAQVAAIKTGFVGKTRTVDRAASADAPPQPAPTPTPAPPLDINDPLMADNVSFIRQVVVDELTKRGLITA